jgi:hypothetical protein
MLPSLAKLPLTETSPKNTDEADETQEDAPNSPQRSRPRPKIIKDDDEETETEIRIIDAAIGLGFAAMPAPLTSEAFRTIFCISGNRLLVGFGFVVKQTADEFDNAANLLLEYLGLVEEYPLDLFSSSSVDTNISVSPFDDFSKFTNAVKKPYPMDDSEMVNKYLECIRDFKSQVEKKEWVAAISSIINLIMPNMLFIFFKKVKGLDAARQARFDELYKNTIENTNSVNLSKIVASYMEGNDKGRDSYMKWFKYFFVSDEDITEVQRQDFVGRNSFSDVIRNGVSDVYHLPDLGDSARSWWPSVKKLFGFATPYANMALAAANVLRVLITRYVTYNTTAMDKYLKANGNNQIEKEEFELQQLAQSKNITTTDPLCNAIKSALKLWDENQKALLYLWKSPVTEIIFKQVVLRVLSSDNRKDWKDELLRMQKKIKKNFGNIADFTSGYPILTALLMAISYSSGVGVTVPAMYTLFIGHLMNFGIIRFRRDKSRTLLKGMNRSFVELKHISQQIMKMKQLKKPTKNETLCGGPNLKQRYEQWKISKLKEKEKEEKQKEKSEKYVKMLFSNDD